MPLNDLLSDMLARINNAHKVQGSRYILWVIWVEVISKTIWRINVFNKDRKELVSARHGPFSEIARVGYASWILFGFYYLQCLFKILMTITQCWKRWNFN